MAQIEFPPLRLAVLNGLAELKQHYAENPELFRVETCPYDSETVDLLVGLFEVKTVERVIEKVVTKRDRGRPKKGGVSDEDIAELEKEVKEQLANLKTMEAAEGLETNEKIQITKTKATLIEKLLEMRERTVNVKRMSEFQTIVIGILDDLVGESEREIFLDRISDYVS